MDHFLYRDGVLHAEAVPVPAIAAAVGTPFYCYSTATLSRHYRVFEDAFATLGLRPTICYALKANSNQAVIRTLADLGAGADVVSGGELQRARAAGIPGERIVFAGVGKTRDEMAAALDCGIFQFNVESEPELRALSEVAASKDLTAPVAIRVNPDIDAGTHHKITTGRSENKFGIPWERAQAVYDLADRLPGLRIVGVAVHIGSQLTDLRPFEQAFARVAELAQALRQAGHTIERLDLGGGLGIPYKGEEPPIPAAYAALVKRQVGHLGLQLVLEPGRMLTGNAGILVSRVIYVKQEGRRFVIIDAAMNDLIRPSLYDAWHEIVPVRQPAANATLVDADVVGPVCESGDIIAASRPTPPLAADDLIAVRSAGAYGAVMASSYNSRPLLPEVLVNGDAFAVVRERQTIGELLALDKLPPWLTSATAARRGAV